MNLRYTIILILVAAALGIFAWTQRATEPVDVSKGAPTATPVALLELKPEDVQEVEVSGADGKYTLTRVAGGWEIDILDNNWTVVTTDGKNSAHFEHTVLITADGGKPLTTAD